MITFTSEQMTNLARYCLTDRLEASLPLILKQLESSHVDYCAKHSSDLRQQQGAQMIATAVELGYTEEDHIRSLLDIEYHQGKRIDECEAASLLHKAKLVHADNRIAGLKLLFELDDCGNNLCVYQSLKHYSALKRCRDMTVDQNPVMEDQQLRYLQMQRQAFCYALLNDMVHTETGWNALRSDFEIAMISVYNPQLKRQLLLQVDEQPEIQGEIEAQDEFSLLTLSMPALPSANQISSLQKLVADWALNLHSPASINEELTKMAMPSETKQGASSA